MTGRAVKTLQIALLSAMFGAVVLFWTILPVLRPDLLSPAEVSRSVATMTGALWAASILGVLLEFLATRWHNRKVMAAIECMRDAEREMASNILESVRAKLETDARFIAELDIRLSAKDGTCRMTGYIRNQEQTVRRDA